MRTTIVLADDHELIRESIASLLREVPDFEVVGQSTNGRQLLELVESRLADSGHDGLVLFSGTIPLLGGHLKTADHFRAVLRNPYSGRELHCGYRCEIAEELS